MSVVDMIVDILEKRGDWMESSRLVREVLKKRDVTDRQAYRYLEKALDAEKIRKIKLGSDVVYGLPDWDFPDASSKRQEEALTFQDAFKYRCLKNLEKISNENVDGDRLRARRYLKHQVEMLPQRLREKLRPLIRKQDIILANTKGHDIFTTKIIKNRVAYRLNKELIGEISKLLHES